MVRLDGGGAAANRSDDHRVADGADVICCKLPDDLPVAVLFVGLMEGDDRVAKELLCCAVAAASAAEPQWLRRQFVRKSGSLYLAQITKTKTKKKSRTGGGAT